MQMDFKSFEAMFRVYCDVVCSSPGHTGGKPQVSLLDHRQARLPHLPITEPRQDPTGRNTRDMETPSLTLIIACLALGAGALVQSPAHAIPAGQEAVVEEVQPDADLPVPAPLPLQAEQSADVSEDIPESAPADPEAVATPTSPPPEPTAAIPCMQGLADAPGDNAAACAGSTADPRPLSFQLGRRIGVNSGILDNYDGIRVDYRLSHGLKLNAVAGYPDISGQKLDSARRMLGFSADSGKFAGDWDMNSFYLQRQNNEGAISRVVGGALRYLRPRRSVLVFADYDVNGDELDVLTATGAWQLHGGTTFSTILGLHHSPVKTRQQKYLQQTMAATEGWTWSLPSERIRYYTADRSEAVRTLAFGLSHAFSDRLKVTGSAAMLDVETEAVPETANAAAPPNEYFYALKLTGRNLVLSGDSSVLDLQHSVTGAWRSSSASINSHYAINRVWNISPRLRANYRNHELERSVRWVTSPAVKMEYRSKHRYGFQIEAGGEWSSEESASQDRTDTSYFLSLGYQAKF